MVNSANKALFIAMVMILTFSVYAFASNFSNLNYINKGKFYKVDLQAIEITGNYISPNGGINISDASKLLINKLQENGTKGDIAKNIKVNEITTKESWENIGIQLYKVDLEYAWINAVALIKNHEVLAILSGMPTEYIFFADLDNDGIYEIYTNILLGSGIISEEILCYNVALKESYRLSMRPNHDLHLYIENGILMTVIHPYRIQHDMNKTRVGKLILKKNVNKSELTLEIMERTNK
jgi:hypothetical protein